MDAFQKAFDDLEKIYPEHVAPGMLHFHVARDFPGMFGKIERAETEANAASVAYIEGKSGGVQAKITAWRDLWTEAIQMLKDGR